MTNPSLFKIMIMMKFLELKIPPPILVLFTGLFMWISAESLPNEMNLTLTTPLSILIFLFGFGITAFAAISFRKAKTTISPTHPQNATVLIHSGLFRLSRNPMYLGMAIMLIGWATGLKNIQVIWGPIFFILYITRLQIVPEEKILTEKWGDQYLNYCLQTRRWL